jgi:hypothetical protein
VPRAASSSAPESESSRCATAGRFATTPRSMSSTATSGSGKRPTPGHPPHASGEGQSPVGREVVRRPPVPAGHASTEWCRFRVRSSASQSSSPQKSLAVSRVGPGVGCRRAPRKRSEWAPAQSPFFRCPQKRVSVRKKGDQPCGLPGTDVERARDSRQLRRRGSRAAVSLRPRMRLGVRSTVALEASCLKVQSRLTARQCCLGQFPSLHPVESEPLVAGCRTVVSLGSMLG